MPAPQVGRTVKAVALLVAANGILNLLPVLRLPGSALESQLVQSQVPVRAVDALTLATAVAGIALIAVSPSVSAAKRTGFLLAAWLVSFSIVLQLAIGTGLEWAIISLLTLVCLWKARSRTGFQPHSSIDVNRYRSRSNV